MKRTHLLCFVLAMLLVVPSLAQAASITPATYSATIGVGDSVTVDKTVTLDPSGATIVDFFFLADNTGSMYGVLGNVQSVAGSLLTSLASTYSAAQFGVGNYLGDPVEGELNAYTLQQAITSSTLATQTAINNWTAGGGGDTPEANFYALDQVATQAATGWRLGSQRVVLWFGDAPSHTETTTEAQAIAALVANGVIVIALNSNSDTTGIDFADEADHVTTATGGATFDEFASVPVADIVSTITSLITTVSGTLDLTFADTAPPGVDVAFTLDDPLGYTGVPGGASRTFKVTFTGVTPGDYTFTVYVPGVASERDHIVVGEGAVPEPSTLALLGLGLLGFGIASRRRMRKN